MVALLPAPAHPHGNGLASYLFVVLSRALLAAGQCAWGSVWKWWETMDRYLKTVMFYREHSLLPIKFLGIYPIFRQHKMLNLVRSTLLRGWATPTKKCYPSFMWYNFSPFLVQKLSLLMFGSTNSDKTINLIGSIYIYLSIHLSI